MCRLLAVTNSLETDLKFSFKRLCEIAKANSHKHGWGIAWMRKGNLVVEKDKSPIWESEKARSLIRNIRSKLIIVHARRNPSQMPLKIRSHPFLHTSLNTHWVFAYNGTVRCPKPKYHKPQSDVDSEIFFCYFLDTLEEVSKHSQFEKEEELVLEALRRSLKNTTIKTALNFILANTRNLYAARLYKKDLDYYTLHYLTRSWENKVGKKIGKQCGEVATVFSSERLTEELWKSLQNNEMAVVSIGFPKKLQILKLYPNILH